MYLLTKFTIASLVFVIPWENAIVISGLGTITRLVGVVAVLIGLICMILKSENLKYHNFHVLLIVFISMGALSFYWSVDPENTFLRIKTYSQILLMTWVVFQYFTKKEEANLLLASYVLGSYVAIYSLLSAFLSGTSGDWQRYAASGFNPNDMAIILALGVPMAWYLADRSKTKIVSILFRLYPFAALFAIMLSASRNGILACLVAFTYPLISLMKTTWKKRAISFSAATVLILVSISLVPSASLDRISTFGSALTSGMNSRAGIWEAGYHYFAQHPIWGSGMGAFREAVAPIFGMPIAPHNVYLSILVEQGIIGFAVFLILLFIIFKCCFQSRGPESKMWLIILTVWSVSAFATNWEWRKQTWIIFILAITHIISVAKKSSNQEREAI